MVCVIKEMNLEIFSHNDNVVWGNIFYLIKEGDENKRVDC